MNKISCKISYYMYETRMKYLTTILYISDNQSAPRCD